MGESSVTLKLPGPFEGLQIDIHNHIGFGPIRFCQEKARFAKGRWFVDIYLLPVEPFLKVHDNRPRA